MASENYYDVAKNLLEDGVAAKYLTFIPTEWEEKLCLRIEIYGRQHVEGGTSIISQGRHCSIVGHLTCMQFDKF